MGKIGWYGSSLLSFEPFVQLLVPLLAGSLHYLRDWGVNQSPWFLLMPWRDKPFPDMFLGHNTASTCCANIEYTYTHSPLYMITSC